MAVAKRSYAPTRGELTTAIADLLEENGKASVREVRTQILTDHPNWKIPERRVAKFVKREKKVKSGVALTEEDDTESVMSTASSVMLRAKQAVKGVGRGVRRVLTPGKKKALETAPKSVLLPAMIHQEDEELEEDLLATIVDSPKPKEIVILPEPESASRSLSDAYVDDNDQKKVKACEPCEGCIIV